MHFRILTTITALAGAATPAAAGSSVRGGPIEEVRPGDVVWFPPGLKHWHGARPTTTMTHIAITESLNGKKVDWLEKVSDEQYRT